MEFGVHVVTSYYDGVILADTPVAFWPLNETTGTTATDATGNGHDGTYTGGFMLGETGIGDGETAVALDGATGYVDVPASTDFQPAAFSWEFWAKFIGGPADMIGIGSFVTGNVDGFYGEVNTPTPSRATFGLGTNAGPAIISTENTVAGEWFYIAGTWDGSTMILYINAAVAGSASYLTSPWVGTPDLILGAGNGLQVPLDGSLAKCAIYNYALTPDQIIAHQAADAAAPTVVTGAGSDETSTSITFNGTVTPNGSDVTSIFFNYGTTDSYGSMVTATPSTLPGADGATGVDAVVTGLSPTTEYHFQLVAENGVGTTDGDDETASTVNTPAASADPTSLTFGDTPIDTSSSAQTITITNIGDADLNVGTALIAGTNPDDFSIVNDNVSGTVIAVSATATIQVIFVPLAIGSRTGTLSIPSDDPATPLEIDLTGTGVDTPSPFPVYDPFGPHSIRYLFTSLDTGSAVIAELPCDSVTFSLTMNESGPFSATFSIEDWTMRYGTQWIKATNPGKTFFWVDIDGVIVYGGWILTRDPDVAAQTVTVSGTDFYGYWARRLQYPHDYGSYELDYTTNDGTEYEFPLASAGGPAPLIAWRVLRDAARRTGSLPNLTFPAHGHGLGTPSDPDEWIAADPSPIEFTASLAQMATADSLVQQLLGLGYGVGFDTNTLFRYDVDGNPHAYTYLHFPRLGTALADYDNPGGPPVLDLTTAINVKWSEDASAQATGIVEMIGSGGGAFADELFNTDAIYTYNYPLVEAAITHTAITPTSDSNAVLGLLAADDLAQLSYPQLAPVITLPVFPKAFIGTDFNLSTGVGTKVGNDITVWNPPERQQKLADGGTHTGALSSIPFPPPGFEMTMRVVRIDVTINDAGVSTMDLTLNQPPGDTISPPPSYVVDHFDG